MAGNYDINQAESWSRSLATLAEERWRNVQAFVHSAARIPACWPLFCWRSSQRYGDATGGVRYSLRAGQHCAQPLLAELGVTGHCAPHLRHIIQRVMWMRW